MLFVPSLPRIGGFRFNTAAVSSGNIQIPPRDIVVVLVVITSYSGADIASLRFNADATATNYGSTWKTQTNAAPPVNAQVANNGTLAHITLGSAGITTGRIVEVVIANIAGSRKLITILNANESATVTEGVADIKGWGEYIVTAGQITQIDLRTSGGANTLGVGSGMIIYGDNLGP